LSINKEIIFVTGVAGFIGFHVARALLQRGDKVIGIDNLNPYYEVSLKEDRLKQILSHSRFVFYREDICNLEALH
jgi:UDP-glucuronate 4-epimerase